MEDSGSRFSFEGMAIGVKVGIGNGDIDEESEASHKF